jgi:hypothetical protein
MLQRLNRVAVRFIPLTLNFAFEIDFDTLSGVKRVNNK